MSEPKLQDKPFEISKRAVWEAYRRVKANKGAAGVDEQSIAGVRGRTCRRTCTRSGIGCRRGATSRRRCGRWRSRRRDGKGVRVLGVPTVADRIAQTVVRMYLEPEVEPIFHPDSYGYRPGRSALDAVGVCRQRCWRSDWVIDLDIRAFFDSVPVGPRAQGGGPPHRPALDPALCASGGSKRRCNARTAAWSTRDRGTPQGSAISPLLANLFMHYAFDAWMAREFPAVQFERYCDDAVVHCRSERAGPPGAGRDRCAAGGVSVWSCIRDKTRIVYCKDADRRGSHEHESFDFLGLHVPAAAGEEQAREALRELPPAVSDDAEQGDGAGDPLAGASTRRSDKSLTDLARMFNSIVQGLDQLLRALLQVHVVSGPPPPQRHLVRWAMRKYKRLRRHNGRARQVHG